MRIHSPSVPEEGMPYRDTLVAKFGSVERLEAAQLQVAQAGADAGVHFHFDSIETRPNSFNAHRLIQWARKDDLSGETKEALFRAHFQEGRDIGDVLVLAEIAEEVGLDSQAAMHFLASDEGADDVRQWEAAAHRLGIGGVPFFIFDRKLGVSGAQPPEALLTVMREALDGESVVEE